MLRHAQQRECRLRILFVCLGNICRSPLAEGVFRQLVQERGLGSHVEVASAGTSGYHEGDSPDPRTTAVARARGIELTSRARKLTAHDPNAFDYLIVMDRENLHAVERLALRSGVQPRVRLLREFDADAGGELDVPDPYFGGARGFEDVHDIVERACRRLLDEIVAEQGLA